MALSNEDYKDVKNSLGTGTAKKVSRVTNDSRNKAIHAKKPKLEGQELEDSLTAKMEKRLKIRSEGIKNTRKLLG